MVGTLDHGPVSVGPMTRLVVSGARQGMERRLGQGQPLRQPQLKSFDLFFHILASKHETTVRGQDRNTAVGSVMRNPCQLLKGVAALRVTRRPSLGQPKHVLLAEIKATVTGCWCR
jgi:hypothetical protein